MLLDMLRQNVKFKDLPPERREVFFRLADEFDENEFALQLTPKELSEKLNIGSTQNWYDFLSLEPVQAYIRAQLGMAAQVAQRKAMTALTKSALGGDTQAAKIINDVSGILNSGDRNKVVVLHRVNRPKQQEALRE